MKILNFRSFLIFTLSLTFSTGAAESEESINKEGISEFDFYHQTPPSTSSGQAQGGLNKSLFFNKSPLGVPIAIGIGVNFNGKTFETYSFLMQPRKAKKAQKKADKKKKQQKDAIKEGSKAAQKRSYEIQSPEVQDRMKQNKKDIAARDKAKKKNNKSKTKRGAKKYK
ncbi:MAG: hypothetical protein HZB98_08095 [Bacteroidia bacterium]|nr:hypothetical protein [Bacteroidia bacterium]